MNFILDENNNPVPCEDILEWANWFEKSRNRHILQHTIKNNISKDEVKISTIFLGVDHDFCNTGVPILWETMVFGGKFDKHQERYNSYEKSRQGHATAIVMCAYGVGSEYMIEENKSDN